MYAIVEIAGHQYKVQQDQQLFVQKLDGNEGDEVSFDRVLLTDNGTVTVGAPVIEGVAVSATIVEHLRGDKIIVFKKKRRKGYRKKNGHKQWFTKIEITSLAGSPSTKSTKKAAPKKAAPKKEAPAAKKVEAKTAVKAAEPKAATKKAPAAKKATAKTKGDDLTKVEGIGPKAAEALNNAGIATFADLASKKADDVKEILTNAPGRLAHLDPGSWAQQSQLAADGKWDELKVLQDKLVGGK